MLFNNLWDINLINENRPFPLLKIAGKDYLIINQFNPQAIERINALIITKL
jgi:hypothetical protein